MGLSVRFKNLLLFTALAAPAGLAIAQTGAARPVPQPQATRPVATQPAATQPVTPQPAAPRPAAQGVPQPGIPQPVIMSVSEAAKRPEHRGRTLRLLIAFLVVIAAGIGLAWAGTNPLRGETTESGVRIRTVEKGEGPFVQPVDGVLVEYEGRLADGTVFDDSARHEEATSYCERELQHSDSPHSR